MSSPTGITQNAPGGGLARSHSWLAEKLFDRAARWLPQFLRPHHGRMALLLGLGVLAAALGLLPPYLSKLVIDQGLMAGDTGALLRWCGALFLAGLAAVALGALSNILHMRASVAMLADLRQALIAALVVRPSNWFAGQRAGELLTRIDGDAAQVQQFAFNAALGGVSAITRLIGGTVMLLVLNWQLGLMAMALAPIELLFLNWARPRTEALAHQAREARGRFSAGLSEMLFGLPALQMARGADWAQARAGAEQAALNERLITQQRFGELTRAVPQILSGAMRAAIFLAGGIMVIRGDWPLGSLIAFIAYMGFMIGPMQTLLGLWHAQARARVALARLDDVMGVPAAPAGQLRPKGYEITLQDVICDRGDQDPSPPLSVGIPAGSKVALSGPSGIGKTRLLAALSGLVPPAHGRIRIGGQPVAQLDPDRAIGRIAHVSQRPFTLRASVRDNLFLPAEFWAGAQAEQKVWALFDILGLSERFRAAQGLATELGENGLTLSGGERQRLCLARALLAGFDILILDEALSEVDPGRTAEIIAYIDATWPDATRIITTHGDRAAYGAFDQDIILGGRS
ncbi:MAG: ABC transporter ATP-binding protein/permease [Mangrovicoccus sp.]|nr:ABC transporter ATP-binding protein/permease [Mangrovicoccus sp.]